MLKVKWDIEGGWSQDKMQTVTNESNYILQVFDKSSLKGVGEKRS